MSDPSERIDSIKLQIDRLASIPLTEKFRDEVIDALQIVLDGAAHRIKAGAAFRSDGHLRSFSEIEQEPE